MMASYGKLRQDILLQPVSGKALPVYRGEVLRIIQEVGGQCVDFNCFNLHDYKERMCVGQMRRQGFRLGKGDLVLSAVPRTNPMMLILEMPETCVTDLLGARCSAELFEVTWGFDIHTNCQDTLAEAIGEYGLTPDDTHDSFNLWMNTGWNDVGEWFARKNTGRKGDHVDLLATMDVLAVPIICGSGDVTGISNWFLKPIRVQVFQASPETEALAQEVLRRYGGLKNQRSPESYRIKDIKADRELRPTPGYQPRFVNYPLKFEKVEVELTPEDCEQVQRLKKRGLGENDEDVVRSAVMKWYLKNRSVPNPFFMKGQL